MKPIRRWPSIAAVALGAIAISGCMTTLPTAGRPSVARAVPTARFPVAWDGDRLGGATPARPRASAEAEVLWPELSTPADKTLGGGESDAALVVGIEDYAEIPRIPGARANASAWFDYLIRTRRVPAASVKLLLDRNATNVDILDTAEELSRAVGPDGTLWFVFIGHGAPSPDGREPLLVGYDAQQRVNSLPARSVKQSAILAALEKSRAKRIQVFIDACFSGRSTDGRALLEGLQPMVITAPTQVTDLRTTILAAARGDQFAGALPLAERPAFSYLALGGLRGWADFEGDRDGQVTAGELEDYVTRALRATVLDRQQVPELVGAKSDPLAPSAREKGPNLAEIAKRVAAKTGATPRR